MHALMTVCHMNLMADAQGWKAPAESKRGCQEAAVTHNLANEHVNATRALHRAISKALCLFVSSPVCFVCSSRNIRMCHRRPAATLTESLAPDLLKIAPQQTACTAHHLLLHRRDHGVAGYL